MNGRKPKNGRKRILLACGVLAVAVAEGLAPGQGIAQAQTSHALRLPGRSISVALSAVSAAATHQTALTVTVKNSGSAALAVSPSNFAVSAQGDMVAAQPSSATAAPVTIKPQHSQALHLTFAVPSSEAQHATLVYHAAGTGASGNVPLDGSPGFVSPAVPPPAASQPPVATTPPATTTPPAAGTTVPPLTINTFYVTQGVGNPWGTAIDKAGNIWFAEPGCDFAPTCGPTTPPGQIGEIVATTHAVVFYTLPAITGNQPIFLVFDTSGNLWFTTPNNSQIGEFSPATGTFIGQWAVTAGSGPWDLVIAGGTIWYTEHLVSAVGSFTMSTHVHRDYATPTANSNPYGITASGRRIWFTENNSSVDKIGVLNTGLRNKISEYPIVLPVSGTPHMITIGASGQPWWTEGWSNTIATINPALAKAGQCGVTSGTCKGITRYVVPPTTACSTSSHTSGIAFQSAGNLVWLDNSLTAQVGSFNPVTSAFALNTLSDCHASPHDGVSLDAASPQDVWFDEEWGSAIGELVP